MGISKLSFASSNSETLLSDCYVHVRGVFNRNKNVNEHFHFNIISYYQASLRSIFNPRVSLEINLNLNITKKLKFTSSFTLYYDNKPVVPIDNYVLKLKILLAP